MFCAEEISAEVFNRINGISYKKDCTVKREELRYVQVLHMGFDGNVHTGELIVNKEIAHDVADIFKELFQAEYPIEKILLVDEYDADDESSMADNNSSGFNFRTISGSKMLSKHARGMAIDINPLYNPYLHMVDGKQVCEPGNGWEYLDRNKDFPHKIDPDDLCYRLFIQHGFTWGGHWSHSKDYQHFQK